MDYLKIKKLLGSGHLNDMTNLADLSEQTILQNLNRRYKEEIIYTYTGTILVACNPYKWIPIYEDVTLSSSTFIDLF